MQKILRKPSALKPLMYPVFRYLWLATVVSNIGTWMQNVSASWVMTSLTSSTLMVALLQSASSLPTVFFSIPAGALADIVNRRKFMIGVQAVMITLAAIMTVIYFAGLTTPWLLLLYTFSIGICTALNAPAWFATTPELVPRADLPEAITLNGIGVNAARAIGPAVAGVIISVYSPGLAFALNALSFTGLIIALLSWKHVQASSTLPPERFMSGMRAGLRYVRQSKHMHRVFLHAGGFFTFASSLWALMPLIARNELQLDASGYGILLTSMGLGSVVAAFILPFFRNRFSRNQIVLGASFIYAAGVITLGLIPPVLFANVAMLACGIAWIASVSSLHVTAQTSTASWVRARALSVYLVILFGGMGFGSIIWGSTAEHIGVPQTLLLSGIGLMITSLLLARVILPKMEADEFEFSAHWGEVSLHSNDDQNDTPVMVSVHYRIAESDADAFLSEIAQVEAIRRRDGAVFWGVCQDIEDKERFVEYFLVESWAEHVRQHGRVTMADKRIQDRVRAYHKGDAPPKVSHLLVRRS